MSEASSLDPRPFQKGFQSLFPEHLGIRLISVEPELIVAEIDVERHLCTAPGLMHGGAIMAFADTLGAVGTSANLQPGAGTTTIESKTNFFRGGSEGKTLRGECRPMHRGRRTQVWQTTIVNPEGKLVAQVTQTQMVL
jgi:uncharacterized protein (TIGR00369 family)